MFCDQCVYRNTRILVYSNQSGCTRLLYFIHRIIYCCCSIPTSNAYVCAGGNDNFFTKFVCVCVYCGGCVRLMVSFRFRTNYCVYIIDYSYYRYIM